MHEDTGITGRSVNAVCVECTRPATNEDFEFINTCVNNWEEYGVGIDDKKRMKSILNVSDCRLGVHNNVVLVEAPQGGIVVIDINNNGEDWVSMPWE